MRKRKQETIQNQTNSSHSSNKLDFLINPFSLKLMKMFSASTSEFEKRPGYVPGGNNYNILAPQEKYLSRVLRIHSNLTGIYERLRYIRVFIQRYPSKQFYLNNGITELDYIQYHFEALSHKIHTISEIMKLLVNEVYCLNIDERKCTRSVLLKKISLDEAPMYHIDDYINTFYNIITFRHLNTHRGYYEDKDKDRIELDYGFSFYKFEKSYGLTIDEEIKESTSIRLQEYLIKEHKKEKLKLIDEILMNTNLIVKDFLGSLEIPFDEQLAKY